VPLWLNFHREKKVPGKISTISGRWII